jgi:hypothetical protein
MPLQKMPRQTPPGKSTSKTFYRDTTLGRLPRHRGAVWHKCAGWIDAGATLKEAKAYVDFTLDKAVY